MKLMCRLIVKFKLKNMDRLFKAGLIFLLFLQTSIVTGQSKVENPDSALAIRLSEIKGTPISLGQAIESAMEKSTEMRQAKAGLMAAQAVYKRELGVFDPELFVRWQYSDDKSPTASFFSGANILETRQTVGQAGIRMSLPYGTELEASLNATRFQTNSTFASLNPQYDANATFTIRQPLLEGFAATARKQLSSAEMSLESAQKIYDQNVLKISTDVEKDYWDLYAAERDYVVQQLVRDQAAALLKETRIRAQSGLIGPNQVANAQVFLAQQELILFDSEEDLDKKSDQFASFIGRRPDAGMKRFIMIDEPPQNFSSDPVDEIVAISFKNSYLVQAAEKDVENARIMAKAADWAILPSIDIIGAIGGNGLTGKGQDIVFNGQTFPGPGDSDLNEAMKQALKRDYPNWSIGLEISYPIGSRTGSGEKAFAQAQLIIAEQKQIETERQLEEEIRSSHRELENGIQRLQIVREQVKAAQEQVRIGLIEYRNGRSTAFELVRLAADFAQSQQRYSQELVRNAKAAATLKQITSGGYPTLKTN